MPIRRCEFLIGLVLVQLTAWTLGAQEESEKWDITAARGAFYEVASTTETNEMGAFRTTNLQLSVSTRIGDAPPPCNASCSRALSR